MKAVPLCIRGKTTRGVIREKLIERRSSHQALGKSRWDPDASKDVAQAICFRGPSFSEPVTIGISHSF
jgi:hypothetical protein